MRILIVSQYFWPENFRINDLAIGLQQRGHQVTVLTGIPNYPGGEFFTPGHGLFRNIHHTHEGVRIHRVPLIPRGKGTAFRLALNYLSFAFFATLLAPFFCRGKFDVFFVFEPSPITVGIPAILLKWIKRVPVLFWVLDLWPDSLSATGVIKSPRILSWVGRLVRFQHKHHESRFTRFYEDYWLPRRFGFHKRRAHFSSLIQTGQMSREAALERIAKPEMDEHFLRQEFEYVAHKLDLTVDELQQIFDSPKKTYRDYCNKHWMIALGANVTHWLGMEKRFFR